MDICTTYIYFSSSSKYEHIEFAKPLLHPLENESTEFESMSVRRPELGPQSRFLLAIQQCYWLILPIR